MPSSSKPRRRGPLVWEHLGHMPYREALAIQMDRWHARKNQQGPDTILTVEHDPVITLGRRADPHDVLLSTSALRARGIDLVRTDRGGEATWHGPGQLVVYPIIDIKTHEIWVSDLVRGLARSICNYLSALNVDAAWNDAHPGVWIADKKIAAVGMRIQKGVSRHGAALNLTTAHDAFQVIVPCGLPEFGVTSVLEQTGKHLAIEGAAEAITGYFAAHFGFEHEK